MHDLRIRFSCFKLLIFMIISGSFCVYGQEYPNEKGYIISGFQIEGNNTTKEKTILREIGVSIGDTIPADRLSNVLQQVQNNVMNLSVFNFVEVSFVPDTLQMQMKSSQHIIIVIQCTERWYIWPVPLIIFEERNFNEWLEHRDLSRLSWGLSVVKENFRGRRELLSVGFKTGFNDMIGIKYTNPAIDKKQSIGIGVTLVYSREHNVFYSTENNSMLLAKLENDFAIQNRYVHFSLTKRFGIYQSFRSYIQYNSYSFSDTLFSLNPNFVVPQKQQLGFLTISLLYKYDFRDYIHYPLEGFYFDCEINQSGFDFGRNDDFSILSVKSSYRTYRKLGERLYFAAGVTGRLRLDDNSSYFFGRGLGFGNDYVRGYENYVIDGRNYMYVKSNIKYNIVKQRILHLNFIPAKKFNTIPFRFYVNAFSDAGYVQNKDVVLPDHLGNKLLFGYGLGIDFVTYYDRAYRIEISRNSENEFSFAVQFTAPI